MEKTKTRDPVGVDDALTVYEKGIFIYNAVHLNAFPFLHNIVR